MSRRKESEFTLNTAPKESISGRLRKLIGERSVRAASQEWGLSFSTLNNYLTRGTEPSLNVAIKIAKIENVTVEWIATGVSEQKSPVQEETEKEKTKEFLRTTWMATFELMGKRLDGHASRLSLSPTCASKRSASTTASRRVIFFRLTGAMMRFSSTDNMGETD